MEEDELINIQIDPMAYRAGKIVDLLHIKARPEFSDAYSQSTLDTMISGLLEPFIPAPKIEKEGNVIQFPKRGEDE